MIDSLVRGVPYYIVFIVLLMIYSKYKIIISRQKYVCSNILLLNKRYLYEQKRRQLLNYAYFVLLIFFGLRGYVYTDFVNYKPFFDMLDGFNNLPEILLLKGWEPGFIVYAAICKSLVPNYFVWNIISTVIDLFLLYKILERYSNNHLLSLMIFFVIGSTALEFNVLRNAKAIFLFLYALRYIEERKIWKYCAIIGIACLFHISSLLFFPLYLVLHKRWPRWLLWSIYIGGAMIMFFHIGIVSDIISLIPFAEGSRTEYLAGSLERAGAYSSFFGNIERIITMLMVIILYHKLSDTSVGNYMFINMYVLLYGTFTICSESVVMVQRFQYMFIASFWILYPLLIEYAKKNKNQLIYLFIVALLSMKLILMAADPNLKYENVITGIGDFDAKVNYVEQNLGK